jgi:hypothetical protein
MHTAYHPTTLPPYHPTTLTPHYPTTGEQKLIDLNATVYEKKATHLRRLLRKNLYDLETAVGEWEGWVKWRHEANVAPDQITDEEIIAEKEEGIFAWRGRNKDNMKCLVITGRALDPIHRKGTFRSFKRVRST